MFQFNIKINEKNPIKTQPIKKWYQIKAFDELNMVMWVIFLIYMNFAFELKKFDLINCDELDKIIAFISDDDPALHETFKKMFPDSNYMLCCYHLQKDLSKKLKKKNLILMKQHSIIVKFFGI